MAQGDFNGKPFDWLQHMLADRWLKPLSERWGTSGLFAMSGFGWKPRLSILPIAIQAVSCDHEKRVRIGGLISPPALR